MGAKYSPPPPGADLGHKTKVTGLLGQRFLQKIQTGGRRFEDSHSTDLRVSGEEDH